MTRTILALAVWLAAAGGAARAEITKGVVPPMEWKGTFSLLDSPDVFIAQDKAQWDVVWAKIGKPAPDADLDKNFAVAVFAGQRPTGGYSFAWDKPFERGGKTVVRYHFLKPKGMVIQAITQPYSVHLFPKTGKPVEVELAQ